MTLHRSPRSEDLVNAALDQEDALPDRELVPEPSGAIIWGLQGYLAHTKTHPPRTLP